MAVTTLRIKVGDNWYSVEVGELTNSPVEVTVEGETFLVEVAGLPKQPPPPPPPGRPPTPGHVIPPPPPPGAARTGPDNILASPLSGRVISILVRPGDQVSTGQEVCVVEAMKMEQSIRAPRDGVVKEVLVQPMDSVRTNDPLIELE